MKKTAKLRIIIRPIRTQLHVLRLGELLASSDFIQHVLDVAALEILNPNMDRLIENLQSTEGDEVAEDQPQAVNTAPKRQPPRTGFATSWK